MQWQIFIVIVSQHETRFQNILYNNNPLTPGWAEQGLQVSLFQFPSKYSLPTSLHTCPHTNHHNIRGSYKSQQPTIIGTEVQKDIYFLVMSYESVTEITQYQCIPGHSLS